MNPRLITPVKYVRTDTETNRTRKATLLQENWRVHGIFQKTTFLYDSSKTIGTIAVWVCAMYKGNVQYLRLFVMHSSTTTTTATVIHSYLKPSFLISYKRCFSYFICLCFVLSYFHTFISERSNYSSTLLLQKLYTVKSVTGIHCCCTAFTL
jgi:hypothetical protein